MDDVVPVGDSFDYIVQGRDALDPQAAALFRSATALYRDKLRPILLAAHNLTEEDAAGDPERLPAGVPRRRPAGQDAAAVRGRAQGARR